MIVIEDGCGWLCITQNMVVVHHWLLGRSTSQHIIGEEAREQNNVNNPHDDNCRHQHTEVERRHTISIDKQAMTYQHQAERKTAHDE